MIGFEVKERDHLPGHLQLMCPHCKQVIRLVTYAQAVLVGCGSCNRIFRTREKNLLVQKQFQTKNEKMPVIPLRKKGRLGGVLYSVVGFISYKEENYAYYWREYVLFHPVHGYAFLSEYDGHWNLFRFISDYTHGKSLKYSFHYNEQKFDLYNKYKVDVLYAEGEFFWDILDDSGHYTEYVAPPYIMNRIIARNEISWMLGEYIEPKEIKEAFSITTEMPLRTGVGASEPFSSSFSFESLKIVVLITTLLLVFLQAVFVKSSNETLLGDASFVLPDSNVTNTLTPLAGPTITINPNWAGSSNLEF
ncbi:MAG: DUF4178 domain-containing protein, partial [Bacteroidota bacterium]|nr:DUF4178 domain-containing protein [Bacteroidota bacterium]